MAALWLLIIYTTHTNILKFSFTDSISMDHQLMLSIFFTWYLKHWVLPVFIVLSMSVFVFVVCTVFGGNTLALGVQHYAVVQPNNIVGCKQYDINKHCVESNRALSSHSNKTVTSSVDNRVKKVSTR